MLRYTAYYYYNRMDRTGGQTAVWDNTSGRAMQGIPAMMTEHLSGITAEGDTPQAALDALDALLARQGLHR